MDECSYPPAHPSDSIVESLWTIARVVVLDRASRESAHFSRRQCALSKPLSEYRSRGLINDASLAPGEFGLSRNRCGFPDPKGRRSACGPHLLGLSAGGRRMAVYDQGTRQPHSPLFRQPACVRGSPEVRRNHDWHAERPTTISSNRRGSRDCGARCRAMPLQDRSWNGPPGMWSRDGWITLSGGSHAS